MYILGTNGNEGPKNLFSKIAYNIVRKAWNCFTMEMIADVTKTSSYVNKHFCFRNMLHFSAIFL